MIIDLSDITDPVIVSSLFFLLCVLAVIWKYSVKASGDKKFFYISSLILISWFVAVVFLSKLNLFGKNPLFVPFIFISWLVLFQCLYTAYKSEKVQKVFMNIPQHWLTLIQTYRIVGIGFIFLYFQGVLPGEFAFPSGIGDIIVGVSAPFVAYLLYKKKENSKKIAVFWNYIGIIDLVMALSAGFLGFPRPIQMYSMNPSTEPMSMFPLAIITLFAVPLALLMHSLSLKKLKKDKV